MPKSILNAQQTKAVTHGNGPLLIIAGAGSGKTTVITERIKHLITNKFAVPSEILALTFTDKAAREMEERVDIALPYGYTQMWISTFHAFCDRILRSDAIHIGLNPAYILMTEAETIQFLRKNIFQFQLNYFRPLGNPGKFLAGMLQHFSRLKDEDISPDEYLSWAQSQTPNANKDELEKSLELAQAYKKYEELKASEGVMDFSDLISNTLKLFRTRKNVLREYQEKFKYILVDEFQDTNFAQNQLAILLSGDRQNITVVGDDDQAIYRWRGAAISNMVQFKKSFPAATIVTLIQNYRSTQEILDKSYILIQQNNPDRLEIQEKIDKHLQSQRQKKGREVEFLFAQRVEDEAEIVVKKIEELISKHHLSYKDIAILVRANDHAQSFVRSLSRHHIPFQFLGPGRLFRQEEIKDLIAYLKVLYNFEDSPSLYRVLNLSVFGLEARDIASFLNFSRKKNISLFETLERIADDKKDENGALEFFYKDELIEKVKTIVEMIKTHLKKVPKESAGQILYFFLNDSGLLKRYLESPNSMEDKKYQNIAKFFDKLKTYESEHEEASVFTVVDWIELSMQLGESPLASDSDWSDNNAVNILTIHSSKGLEFPAVFLVNLVAQRFPVRERREQIPIPQDMIKEILPVGDYHLQEERRLFYVGMTRARDFLYLTAAHFYGEGKRERKISPFVSESLGQELIDRVLKINRTKQTVIQPTLLEWAESNKDKAISDTAANSTLITNYQKPITINYISYSQIQTFEICPLHYKLHYILKIPSSPTPSLSFGTSIHSALRDFYQTWIKEKTIEKERIHEFLKKNWAEEGYDSKIHQKEAYDKAIFVLENYLKDYFNPKAAYPIAVEIPFQFFVKHEGRPQSLKVGGRIDRIDKWKENGIEILDYKTGNNVPEEKELAQNLQLTMYGLAAAYTQTPPFNRDPNDVILSLYYLEEDVKLTTTRTLEQMEECKHLIFKKVEEIEKSEFKCNGSVFCHNCEYKMLCSV